MVKNVPANKGDVSFTLGQEDPLEKEMATHSSILSGEIPWTEEPRGLQSTGSQRVEHNLVIKQQQKALGLGRDINLSNHRDNYFLRLSSFNSGIKIYRLFGAVITFYHTTYLCKISLYLQISCL